MPCPTDVKGVQHLGGFDKISTTHCRLDGFDPQSKVPWMWFQIHEDAFGKIKMLVIEIPVLRYDHSKPLVIHCNASEKAVGCLAARKSTFILN